MSYSYPLPQRYNELANEGLGKDLWTLEPEQITATLYHFWVEAMLYNFVMTFTKISIILLYLRIWTSENTWTGRFRMACFVLIALHVAYAIAIAFTVAFECAPVSLTWTRWDGEHHGTCVDYQAQSYAISALNVVLDFATFLLPIPKLVTLNISIRKKIGVCFTFLVGFLATLFSIIRLAYLARYSLSANFTWHFAQIAIFTALECDLALICACLPSMAGLFQKAWGSATKSWRSRSASRNSPVPNRIHLSTLDSYHTAREPGEGASTVQLQATIAKYDDRAF
ncbi:Satratoxin biosynthesis SC1 cluster protein 4 [Pseudocercospora fuligena]|uniref:Satratoxin biosynthesis SC1 cluster protein 4 n=1 Tax=Pseudocercospora fuligena TaxID=685502 RepID=A0A8H6RW57_9PEZI|nr:Satratoxin biosynthesis SC1 cluster protein 4 [Pseudocercospora fuligena]